MKPLFARWSTPKLASPSVQAKLERELVLHTYDLMSSEGVGGAFASAALTLAIAWLDTGWRYALWASLQLAAMVTNIWVYGTYRKGEAAHSTEAMRRARRGGILVTAVAWSVGGLLFPLGNEVGLGFALFFCYAGLCAGAASTMAGDPIAYLLFAGTALLPATVVSFFEHWWISVLLVAYFLVTTDAVFRHRRALMESLLLRFENKELLEQTIAEREAAILARADAENAAVSKTRFLAAASHDLRQPVQALSLFVDLLQRDPRLDLRERARALEALGRTTDAMRAMLEALLDISRLDAGIVESAPRPVPLEPLLAEITTALRDEAETHDMVISAAGSAPLVHADPTFLSRVLHNLATNAVRHARRGRVLIAVRTRATCVRVQIWDQGPGIAEADRERIFEEYVQLENRERDRRKGLGLGLPMVRRMCELAGWPLTLRSVPGKGSVFEVTIPRAFEEITDEVLAQRAALEKPLSVLLVEDDMLVSDAIVASLESSGSVVHATQNVADAREKLAAMLEAGTPPDVIVTDHRLPGEESGADFARTLLALDTPFPVVLMTGDDLDETLGTAVVPGLARLRKPVSAQTLWRAMRSVLRARGRLSDERSVEQAI